MMKHCSSSIMVQVDRAKFELVEVEKIATDSQEKTKNVQPFIHILYFISHILYWVSVLGISFIKLPLHFYTCIIWANKCMQFM